MAGDSRTEKATPKKRRDERKKGNIFMSQDVISLVIILGWFLFLKAFWNMLIQAMGGYLKECLENAASWTDASSQGLLSVMGGLLLTAAMAVFPTLALCVLLSVLSTGIQTRFLFKAESFAPKFKRLSPLENIQKQFNRRYLVELLKNLLQVAILAVVVYLLLKDDMPHIMRLMNMPLQDSAAYVLDKVMAMGLRVSLVYAVVAAFDYLYQWWDYEQRLKMSKQEVKEEFKQLEGNPEIKRKIRNIQRSRARARMMQAVPQADVIIRNPTHYAVALRYRADRDNAPVVLAKGQDELALRIVKRGEECQIPVIENKLLARGLYAVSELGREIPAEYYGAVAEILVYVYQIRQRTKN